MKTNASTQRYLVIGAARQGLAAARYLVRCGMDVVINDNRPAESMTSALEAMQGLPVQWILGSHPLSALDSVDVVCISGGVPLTLPIVVEAQRRGIPLTNDTQVFMEAVPCPTIGITGSAGKTTTTTLVGRMAQSAVREPRRVWTGGNIGLPLIDFVNEMHPDDLAILEISSFQLEQMTLSPHVAAVLNITPNHLDRHGTMEAYTAAKARILDFQTPVDVAVLNREDPGSWGLRDRVKGRLVTFGLLPPPAGTAGTFVRSEMLMYTDGSAETVIMPQSSICLVGKHNLVNVLAACAIALAAGLPVEALVAGVTDFHGVAHRLEFVRTYKGANWYNDSIATAPERAMAAIHSFTEPLVLLAGGRDKKLPWDTFAHLIHQRVDHLIVFGEAADLISNAVGPMVPNQRPYTITHCGGLKEAVTAAANLVETGDVVLLSPGGTSFDEFRDFEERGESYRTWVKELS
jgi:UDP-N-acetylmuramoylalanine--D-glutamate ligase